MGASENQGLLGADPEQSNFESPKSNVLKRKSFLQKYFWWMIAGGVVFGLLVIGAVVAAIVVTEAGVTTPENIHISQDGIFKHLNEFEKIAMENDGSRSITRGYNASVDYVVKTLEETGKYNVEVQHFQVPAYDLLDVTNFTITNFDQPSAQPKRCNQRTGWQRYESVCDFAAARYGGNGDVDLVDTVVQYVSVSCQAEDFAAFVAGNIALIDLSSDCIIFDQVTNAQAAGAVAVIMTYPVSATVYGIPGGRVFDSETWTPETVLPDIPTIGVANTFGSYLRNRSLSVTVNLQISQRTEVVWTSNVIADHKDNVEGQDVIMSGSHLDSVPAGPGINDNGTGSASNLELAITLADSGMTFKNGLRFGWWGAEEIGLMGSRFYVKDLLENHRDRIPRAYFNFDMEAAPNGVRQVHDGSTAGTDNIESSTAIQKVWEAHFDKIGLAHDLSPMNGGSDFFPFTRNGIPAGGLATGASGIKTADERTRFGGFANAPHDPCYHAPCDTVANVGKEMLLEMSEAMVHVISDFVVYQDVSQYDTPSNDRLYVASEDLDDD